MHNNIISVWSAQFGHIVKGIYNDQIHQMRKLQFDHKLMAHLGHMVKGSYHDMTWLGMPCYSLVRSQQLNLVIWSKVFIMTKLVKCIYYSLVSS